MLTVLRLRNLGPKKLNWVTTSQKMSLRLAVNMNSSKLNEQRHFKTILILTHLLFGIPKAFIFQ